MRPIVLDECVKLRDPCSNRSREIPPAAFGGGIVDSLFRYNFRPEGGDDVISDVAADYMLSGWIFLYNLVILGQTILQILEGLISCRTNEHNRSQSHMFAVQLT